MPFRRAHLPLSLIAIAAVVAAGCGGGDSSTSTTADSCQSVSQPAPTNVKLKKPTAKAPTASSVVFDTSCGSFTVALDAKTDPATAASMQYLAEQGAYDNTSINRIAPGFVIQGGDPTETQAGDAGYTIVEKVPSNVVYRNGVVAMAKSAAQPPGASGSQFFIVIAPADAGLPPEYAVAGKISDGQDTIKRIEDVGTSNGSDGPPAQPIVINSATTEG